MTIIVILIRAGNPRGSRSSVHCCLLSASATINALFFGLVNYNIVQFTLIPTGLVLSGTSCTVQVELAAPGPIKQKFSLSLYWPPEKVYHLVLGQNLEKKSFISLYNA